MRGELPNLLNFSFQHFGHVSVSAFSFLICRKLFPNLRTAGHDSCPGVKCGFAPSPPFGETQEVSKLKKDRILCNHLKFPWQRWIHGIYKRHISLCVPTWASWYAGWVCGGIRQTYAASPSRPQPSPAPLTSFIEVHFWGSAVRNALCLLNRLLPSSHCYFG